MKKMLITGTTQGIGNHLYMRFYNKYEILTINRREFTGNNYICNLADLNQTVELCNFIRDQEFDILINNAGGGAPVRFQELSVDVLQQCTNLNYHSPVLIMQAVLENMKKNGYGRIVNISSIAAKSPRALISHYGAAKAALEAFSKSTAVCYANCGITVNCICPGGVETITSIYNRRNMAVLEGNQMEYCNQEMMKGNGLGRMVKQKEVGDLVEFFISDASEAISGQTLNICGIKEVHA